MAKKATKKNGFVSDDAMNRRMWHSIADSCPFECWIGFGTITPVRGTLRADVNPDGYVYFYHDAFKVLNTKGVFAVWQPNWDQSPEYRYKKDKVAFYKPVS